MGTMPDGNFPKPMAAHLLVPNLLWACGWAELPALVDAVDPECIVSVLPIGSKDPTTTARYIRGRIAGRARHRIVVAHDHDPLPPEYVDHALSFDGSTIVHCNAGANRSVALAACWRLRHDCPDRRDLDPDAVIDHVIAVRRGRVTDEMRENVRAYAGWLRMKGAMLATATLADRWEKEARVESDHVAATLELCARELRSALEGED